MDSIKTLEMQHIEEIMKTTKDIKNGDMKYKLLKNTIFGLLFFEPSTRTCLSFESAIHRLGCKIIKYNSEYSSEKKGETLEDTIKTLNHYVDVFIIRHPEKNIISKIKTYTNKPIINAAKSLNSKNKVDQFSQTKNKTISLLKKINNKNK